MKGNNYKAKTNKKSNLFSWVFWWKVDMNELTKQITEYQTLNLFHSARKVSALLLFLSSIVTTFIVFAFNLSFDTLIDAVLMMLLGIFIYHGYRWAMIVAMIYWTFTKIYTLFPNETGVQADILTALIWWLVYMHFFYLAFKVEKERKKSKG